MKGVLIFTLLLLIASCSTKTEIEDRTYFYSQDSLYEFSFVKPTELDTFYRWDHFSDNSADDNHKMRFSKSNFPLKMENGSFSEPEDDTTYRITFSHNDRFKHKCMGCNFNEINPKVYLDKKVSMARKMFGDKEPVSEYIDTLFSRKGILNNQQYVVYAYKIDETGLFKVPYGTHYVEAIFYYNNEMFFIQADCRSFECEEFISKMEGVIKTINIKKHKVK